MNRNDPPKPTKKRQSKKKQGGPVSRKQVTPTVPSHPVETGTTKLKIVVPPLPNLGAKTQETLKKFDKRILQGLEPVEAETITNCDSIRDWEVIKFEVHVNSTSDWSLEAYDEFAQHQTMHQVEEVKFNFVI